MKLRRPFRRLMSTRLVVALAIGAAALVLLVCAGLLTYAATTVDEITQAREQKLVARTLERRLSQIKDDVVSAAVWNDAYDHTAQTFDPEWARVNIGEYFHDYMHHDISVLMNEDGQPIYAAIDGNTVDIARVAGFVRAARPIIGLAASRSAARAAAKPGVMGMDRLGTAEAGLRVGNRLFLATAATVTAESDYARPLVPGPDHVIVSAIELTPTYRAELGKDFGLKDVRLSNPVEPGPGSAVIRGPGGAAVGSLIWTPERPGVGVVVRARWLIVGVTLAVVMSVAMLVFRMMRTAKALERARDRAEAGERAKAEFIANMSHEIRTPLNGVLGMAQAMEADELAPAQRTRLRIIRESGATLLAILNDVLDLSKIEAVRLELEDTVFRLDEKAEQICAMFSESAAAKGVQLIWACDASAGGWWHGDTHRIGQILTNLVSNALKFTERGSVQLSVSASPVGVRFEVRDTGIGIDPARAELLFAKFTQADASTTRRFGGTGLGLSICRALTDLMGGQIAVSSVPGKGSTFTVVLPLQRADHAQGGAAEAGEEAAQPIETLRILAAEDNLTNQLVLRALLDPLGVDLTVVGDGQAALDAFASQPFDLVLMDIQMPRMNGVDATRAIRMTELQEGRARTPILALTANVMSHQLDAYFDAGMDGHVAKPLDAADLYARIAEAVSVGPQDEAAAA